MFNFDRERLIEKLIGLATSRRFWALIGTLVFLLVVRLGLPIPKEMVMEIVALVGAWIVGDSLRSTEPPETYPTSANH